MKVPEDRNPCLTFVAAEKKPASRFTKKGEVLEDTHEIPQRGSRVQRCCSHVAQVKVPEDRNPCLTFVAAEKKPALRFTKKGEVFKSTHEIAMEAIRSRPSPSRGAELFSNIVGIGRHRMRSMGVVIPLVHHSIPLFHSTVPFHRSE